MGYLLVRHDTGESSDSCLDPGVWWCRHMHWTVCMGTPCYKDSRRGSYSYNTFKVKEIIVVTEFLRIVQNKIIGLIIINTEVFSLST